MYTTSLDQRLGSVQLRGKLDHVVRELAWGDDEKAVDPKDSFGEDFRQFEFRFCPNGFCSRMPWFELVVFISNLF